MFNGIQPQDVAQFAGNYYVAVRNPYWLNAEHTLIECEVNFNHVGFEEWTPFCADPNDYMPYSKLIFDECVAGNWGLLLNIFHQLCKMNQLSLKWVQINQQVLALKLYDSANGRSCTHGYI